MEEITSITITKIAENLWKYHDNTMNSDDGGSDNYSGTWYGNLVTIKTKTGQPIYNRQPYTLFTYVDSLDSGNDFTPSSATNLIAELKSRGFFGDSSGGGEGGATTIVQLLDVFNSMAGRGGQFLKINDDETLVITQALTVIQRFTDLLDWTGGNLQPNNYILTSSLTDGEGNAMGLVQAPIQNIVNRPWRYDEVGLYRKGAVEIDGVIVYNQEDFVQEVGDVVDLVAFDEESGRLYHYPVSEYLGGTVTDPANYDWAFRIVLLEIEPTT